MKTLLIVALLTGAATAAFALGRTTGGNGISHGVTEIDGKDVTLRVGDQLRVPSVSLFCTIFVEVERTPTMLCNRTGERPRYQVRFERGRTEVGRIGFPGEAEVFPER